MAYEKVAVITISRSEEGSVVSRDTYRNTETGNAPKAESATSSAGGSAKNEQQG